ncbi:MAG: hypothetical protein J6Q39_04040 [Bacteroidales bacterium]|nr:hypothetical protein [Bacteroidales bacterium]
MTSAIQQIILTAPKIYRQNKGRSETLEAPGYTPTELPEVPEQSSQEWYESLVGTPLDMGARKYYENNTLDIVKYLGVEDRISPEEISQELASGRMDVLDTRLLSLAKEKFDNKIEEDVTAVIGNGDPVLTQAEKIREIRARQFPYSLDNIIQFRADAASKYIAEQTIPLNETGPAGSVSSVIKEEGRALQYKAQALAQAYNKNAEVRKNRTNLEAFGDLVENAMPGVRSTQYFLLFKELKREGFIDEQTTWDAVKNTFLTGSADSYLRKLYWSKSPEEATRLLDFIQNKSTVINRPKDWLGGNELLKAAILDNMFNQTEGTKWVNNTLDIFGAYGSYKTVVKPAINLGKQGFKTVRTMYRARNLMGKLDDLMGTAELRTEWQDFLKTSAGKRVKENLTRMSKFDYSYDDAQRTINDPAFQNFFKKNSKKFKEAHRQQFEDEIFAPDPTPSASAKAAPREDIIIDGDFTVLKTGGEAAEEATEVKALTAPLKRLPGPSEVVEQTKPATQVATKGYRVHVGSQVDSPKVDTEGYVHFNTKEEAVSFANEVFDKTGTVLSVTETPKTAPKVKATKAKLKTSLIGSAGSEEDLADMIKQFYYADSVELADEGVVIKNGKPMEGVRWVKQGRKNIRYRFEKVEQELPDTSVTPEPQETIGPAITRALNEGETAIAEGLTGNREAAAKSLASSIESKTQTGEPLSTAETFALMPSVGGGGNRNTIPFINSGKSIKDVVPSAFPKNVWKTRQELQDDNYYFPAIDTFDHEAFSKLQADAQSRWMVTTEALRDSGLDIRTAKMTAQPAGTGLEVEMVYGIGPLGINPITQLDKQTLDSILDQGMFEPFEDEAGNLFIKRRGFVSADGVWTPLNEKPEGMMSWIPNWLGSIETTQPVENIEAIRGATMGRAGVMDQMLRKYKNSQKGTTFQQRNKAEAILREEWNKQEDLSFNELFERADGDEKVMEMVETTHSISKDVGSFTNNLMRDELNLQGYKELEIGKNYLRALDKLEDHDFSIDLVHQPVIAKKIEDPGKSDMRQKFVLDLEEGTIYNRNNPVGEIKENSQVWMLEEPIINNGTDKIRYVIVPSDVRVNALPNDVLGYVPLSGWLYNYKWFARFERFFKDSVGDLDVNFKTVIGDSTLHGIKSQIKKLQAMARVFVDATLDEAQKTALIQNIAFNKKFGKHPIKITSYKEMADFVKEQKLNPETLVSDLDRIQIKRNTFSPFDSATLKSQDKEDIYINNIAHRFIRGDYSIKNLRHSASEAQLVDLNKFILSTAQRAGQLAGIENYKIIASNRFWAKHKHLVDPSNTPQNPEDFMLHFKEYADPRAKTDMTSDYHEALYNSEAISRALDYINTNQDIKRALASSMKKFLNNDNFLANSFTDLMLDANPDQALKGFLYNSVFMLNPKQFITQSSILSELVAQHPVHGTRGAAGFFPLRYLMNTLKRGGDIKRQASVLAKWPAIRELAARGTTLGAWSALDLESIAKAGIRYGLGDFSLNDIRGNNVYQNIFADTPAGGVVDSLTKGVIKTKDMAKVPFNEGNMTARTLAFITATSEVEEELGKRVHVFTDADWNKVASKADIYSGGISTANKRKITNVPVLGTLSMMTQFQLMRLEKFFGKTIFKSPKEAALFATILLGLFGYDFAFDSRSSYKASMKTSDEIYDLTGIQVDPYTLKSGILGAVFTLAAGYKGDFSAIQPQVLNNWYTDLAIRNITSEDTDINQRSFFMLQRLKDLAGQTKYAFEVFQDPKNTDSLWATMSTSDKMRTFASRMMNNFSGYTDLQRMYYAKTANMYINKRGVDTITDDYVRSNLFQKATIQAATGIRPLNEGGLTKLVQFDYSQDLTKEFDDTVKEMSKLIASAVVADNQNRPDIASQKWQEYMQLLDIASEAYSWTSRQINEAQSRAIQRAYESMDPSMQTKFFVNPMLEESKALKDSVIEETIRKVK